MHRRPRYLSMNLQAQETILLSNTDSGSVQHHFRLTLRCSSSGYDRSALAIPRHDNMSLPSPPAKHDSSARLRSSSPDFTQEETINGEPEIGDENKHEPDHAPSNAAFAAPSEDVTLAPTTANDLGAQFSDTGSTYYSARSRISFRSFFTRSTGKRSQNGATWLQALTKTMNSGFGTGTLVTEGRERGGYLPPITGVGRTGKAPAPVPASMLEALGVKVPEADIPVKSAPIYGLTLEALHERDGTLVPSLVHAVIELVELHGLEVKDIYIGVLADVDMENEVFEGLQNNGMFPCILFSRQKAHI